MLVRIPKLAGRLVAGLLGAALLAGAAHAGSDYERERKWAEEIKPNIMVGDAIDLQLSSSPYPVLSLFAPGDPDRAVILVHGMGVHPDWGLIGRLRSDLHDHGYTTLSIQMPILAADADPNGYRALIPEGASRISRAVSYLVGQGYGNIAIVSHSLGSRMTNLYMTNPDLGAVRAWASLGITDPTYVPVKLPILDLYGEADNEHVLKTAKSRAKSFKDKKSKQQVVSGAGHFYEGHEKEMVGDVEAFLDKVMGKPKDPAAQQPAAAKPAAAAPAK